MVTLLFLSGFLRLAVAAPPPPLLEIYYPYGQAIHRTAGGVRALGTLFSAAGVDAVTWETSSGGSGTATVTCGAAPTLCTWETGMLALPPGLTVVTIHGRDLAGAQLSEEVMIESRGYPVTHRVDCALITSGDGSVSHPFNTLQEAVEASYAGDTIQINGGACTSGLDIGRGVTIQGDPESPPAVIQMTGNIWTGTPELVSFRHLRMVSGPSSPVGILPLFSLFSANNVPTPPWQGAQTLLEDVEGARIVGSYQPLYTARRCRGLFIDPASGGSNIYADVQDSTGVRLSGYPYGGVVNVAIRNSEITEFRLDNDGAFRIDIEHSLIRSGDFLLAQNIVSTHGLRLALRDSRVEAPSFWLNRLTQPCDGPCDAATAPLDVIIERNIFTNSHVGLDLSNHARHEGTGSQSILVQNNVMERTSVSLHLEQSNATTSGLTRTLIRHNTFIGAQTAIGVAGTTDQSAPPDWAVEIANNIFDGNGTAIVAASEPAGLMDVHILGNDFHANGADLEVDTSAIVDGNISFDPLFRERLTGDYRLRVGSPCIDAALDIDTPPADDIAGSLRPQDGDGDGVARSDIGAFEAPAVPALRRSMRRPMLGTAAPAPRVAGAPS